MELLLSSEREREWSRQSTSSRLSYCTIVPVAQSISCQQFDESIHACAMTKAMTFSCFIASLQQSIPKEFYKAIDLFHFVQIPSSDRMELIRIERTPHFHPIVGFSDLRECHDESCVTIPASQTKNSVSILLTRHFHENVTSTNTLKSFFNRIKQQTTI